MEFVRMWILNIVSVILIISFIEIILPENDMKKFINLALGFIIILVIISPVVKLINSEIDLEEAVYTYSNSFDKSEYVISTDSVKDKQNEQLLNVYKDKIKADVKYRIENKYDVSIKDVKVDVETEDKDKMGDILSVNIIVDERREEGQTVPIVKIDLSEQEKDINNTAIESKVKEDIAHDISSIYNLETMKINVSE